MPSIQELNQQFDKQVKCIKWALYIYIAGAVSVGLAYGIAAIVVNFV